MRCVTALLLLFLSVPGFSLRASEWPAWRGPESNGVSPERGLITDWSLQGKNLIWRADFQGRSTPVVLNGRVYVIGRVGEGVDKQERVVAYDARTGQVVWEHRFNVYLTTVPFPRVGWASPVADPETGNIYVHGVGGGFFCFDRDGRILWRRSLTEEFGRMSGYGGRTHTPVIDGSLVILSFVSNGWGDQAAPRHRYFAFDKRSGELGWVSTPGGRPADLNTYSTPVVAEVAGQRLLIGGNADGGIYALKAGTGERVWKFQLSQRGINASVVVDGTTVIATHSEENIDEATMGRVVAIDATGSGDLTATHELWRHNEFTAGFASPLVAGSKVYVVSNSGNLVCLDRDSGQLYWEHSLGTVGKGSPVWAEGRIYATELNGTFHVLQPGPEGCQTLSKVTIPIGNRHAEIFGSPAVAYGRIYFASEEGIYCLGDPAAPFSASATRVGPVAAGSGPVARVQVVPAEVMLQDGETVDFRLLGFDAAGKLVGAVEAVWQLEGVGGEIDARGRYSAQAPRAAAGSVSARSGELGSSARVRVWPRLPWMEDFEALEDGQVPAHWIGARGRFAVREREGGKILVKAYTRSGIQRSYVFAGPADLAGYTVQVDLLGNRDRRRVPDMGLISHRYIMQLTGRSQELQVHSWASELRMEQKVPFAWEPGVWYTMKMKVDLEGGRALIRGKVWPRSQAEPEGWSIEAVDPHPNREGTPGLYGQSYADIHYDNFKVTRSQP